MNVLKTLLVCCLTLTVQLAFNQSYDVLALESFDNTTNLSTDTGFGSDGTTCGQDKFTTTSHSNVTGTVTGETGSVFAGADINGISGVSTPSYVIALDYTADHDDEIYFTGEFAINLDCASQSYNTSDILIVKYSSDNGSTWTTGITLIGNNNGTTYDLSDDYLNPSDGTAYIQNTMLTKEFSCGNNHNGNTLKIKVEVYGFTGSSEEFILDNFQFVKHREVIAAEDFNNTTSLSSSSGSVFQTPVENASCGSNDIYDVTANMTTPSNAYGCVIAEDGDFFVISDRGNLTGVADGEELVMLTHTVTTNNEISFRGNFASFSDDQNADNSTVVQYSTDNGSTYTTGLTLTGVSGAIHSVSDGSSNVLGYLNTGMFHTKGFVIGDNLNGQTIKIKVIFNDYTNGGDGIALDKFVLEKSMDAPSGGILPVELLTFNIQKNDYLVELDWTTASENNNDYFEIQRSSDGYNFETIDIVNGNGTSTVMNNYSYTDFSPLSGTSYYRLKQVDFDGQFEIFQTLSISFDSGNFNSFRIVSNEEQNILIFDASKSKSMEYLIVDNLGRRIDYKSFSCQSGNNRIILNYLPKGVYHISLFDGSKKQSVSLIQ